jgi:2-keto-4-pentenoate hydratase/2-oxohepta-3-ene-1,7-dioic acid hydratase in catechol pathway
MRLVTYDTGAGTRFGAIKEGGIVDLSTLTRHASLHEVIAAGALAVLEPLVAAAKPMLALSDVRLLPPMPNPGKIICVGLNYHAHVAETGHKLTERPTLFNRYPESQMAI